MAIKIDLIDYGRKIDACRTLLDQKKVELDVATDPLVRQSIGRSIDNVGELLSTYEKIFKSLKQIERLDLRMSDPGLRQSRRRGRGDPT